MFTGIGDTLPSFLMYLFPGNLTKKKSLPVGAQTTILLLDFWQLVLFSLQFCVSIFVPGWAKLASVTLFKFTQASRLLCSIQTRLENTSSVWHSLASFDLSINRLLDAPKIMFPWFLEYYVTEIEAHIKFVEIKEISVDWIRSVKGNIGLRWSIQSRKKCSATFVQFGCSILDLPSRLTWCFSQFDRRRIHWVLSWFTISHSIIPKI